MVWNIELPCERRRPVSGEGVRKRTAVPQLVVTWGVEATPQSLPRCPVILDGGPDIRELVGGRHEPDVS